MFYMKALVKINSLSKAINLNIKENIAVIGMGGKSSFCYNLCLENIDKKIALSTTTKMYEASFLDIKCKEELFHTFYEVLPKTLYKGVNFFGKSLNTNPPKVGFISEDFLSCVSKISDNFIYEADGSKQKMLKCWKQNEPVFLQNTHKIIGILPIKVLYKQINESFIHNILLFLQKTNTKLNDIITFDILRKVVFEMFKKAPKNAKKYIFINHVENEKDLENAIKLSSIFEYEVFLGSLKTKQYYHE